MRSIDMAKKEAATDLWVHDLLEQTNIILIEK